jgi:hypothetical protein
MQKSAKKADFQTIKKLMARVGTVVTHWTRLERLIHIHLGMWRPARILDTREQKSPEINVSSPGSGQIQNGFVYTSASMPFSVSPDLSITISPR